MTRAELNEYARRYRRANPEKSERAWRRSKFKRHYGISLEDYDRTFAAQGGRCAICGRSQPPDHTGKVRMLSVDHNHTTQKFRGLLCRDCNTGLGMFQDNPAILGLAIQYLAKVQ